jgi:hypothetical protein
MKGKGREQQRGGEGRGGEGRGGGRGSELKSALLPPRLRDVKDSGIDVALAAWSELATYPSCATSVPDAPASFIHSKK